MKKDVIFLSVLVLFSVLLIFTMSNFTKDVKGRPLYQKLGFIPQGKLYNALLGEFRWSSGEYFTFKATTYYGGKSKSIMSGRLREVEYYNLYRTIQAAILLNPYHEDAYYFAEGAFAWDIGRVRETNALLKYVIKYRNWDFKIPFFLGFNYAYFLKDYEKAAVYFKKAAEMTHSSLFTNLAARYFYEGGETELGITFLKYMISNPIDSLDLGFKEDIPFIKTSPLSALIKSTIIFIVVVLPAPFGPKKPNISPCLIFKDNPFRALVIFPFVKQFMK